jgi:transcriptional regulator with XRE-family HTH domain
MEFSKKLDKLLPHGDAVALVQHMGRPVTAVTVNRWRSGKSKPNPAQQAKIAQFLNVSLLWLCDPKEENRQAQDSLTPRQRYLLELAHEVGVEVAINRVLLKNGDGGLTSRLPTLVEEAEAPRKGAGKLPKKADGPKRRKANG